MRMLAVFLLIFIGDSSGDLQRVENSSQPEKSRDSESAKTREAYLSKVMIASNSARKYFLNKLPNVLKSKILVTDDAEKVVLEDYVNSQSASTKALDAYNLAKKDEREILKRLVQEVPQILPTYKALRKGVAWNYTRLHEKFRKFFEEPSATLEHYEAFKKDESTSLDSFLADSGIGETTKAAKHSTAVEETEKVEVKGTEKRNLYDVEIRFIKERDNRKMERGIATFEEVKKLQGKEKVRELVRRSTDRFESTEDEESENEKRGAVDEEYQILSDSEKQRQKEAKEEDKEYLIISSEDAKQRMEDRENGVEEFEKMPIVVADESGAMSDFQKAESGEVGKEKKTRVKAEVEEAAIEEIEEAEALKDEEKATGGDEEAKITEGDAAEETKDAQIEEAEEAEKLKDEESEFEEAKITNFGEESKETGPAGAGEDSEKAKITEGEAAEEKEDAKIGEAEEAEKLKDEEAEVEEAKITNFGEGDEEKPAAKVARKKEIKKGKAKDKTRARKLSKRSIDEVRTAADDKMRTLTEEKENGEKKENEEYKLIRTKESARRDEKNRVKLETTETKAAENAQFEIEDQSKIEKVEKRQPETTETLGDGREANAEVEEELMFEEKQNPKENAKIEGTVKQKNWGQSNAQYTETEKVEEKQMTRGIEDRITKESDRKSKEKRLRTRAPVRSQWWRVFG